MSTSIVNESTLRHVAATIVALTCESEGFELGHLARRFTKEVAGDALPIQPTELAASIYNNLIRLNNQGLEGQYPSLKEHRNNLPQLSTLSVKENKLPLLNEMGILHFKENLKILAHGFYDNEPESLGPLIMAAIDTQAKLALNVAQANNKIPVTPTISEVAESATRLGAYGDFLLGMQSGYHSIIEQLTAINGYNPLSTTPQELVNNFYIQALKAAELKTPESKVNVQVDARGFESSRFRTSVYRIQSDIPAATAQDVLIVTAALKMIASNIHKMDISYSDMDEPMSPQANRRIANKFGDAANRLYDSYTSALHSGINRAFYLPYEEMRHEVGKYHAPNVEALIVYPDGKYTPDEPHDPRKVLPARLKVVDKMLHCGKNSRFIVPSNDWSEQDIANNFPNAEVLRISISKKDLEMSSMLPGDVYHSAIPLLVEKDAYQVLHGMKLLDKNSDVQFNQQAFINSLAEKVSHVAPDVIVKCFEYSDQNYEPSPTFFVARGLRNLERFITQHPEMDRPADELKKAYAPATTQEALKVQAPSAAPSSSPKP